MTMKFLWPGKTRSAELRAVQESYRKRISRQIPCRIIETAEAKGLDERSAGKIMEIEAKGLEKHMKDDYIICLFDKGVEMDSAEFSRFLGKRLDAGRAVTFVVGGFLGLAERILERANFRLSLSKMTFSHELSRVILLEQVYRSISILKGRHYAK
ncbi:MAG: 23S rRNA (pseudouridine(1915)-N(3))-methyltransferase RlmH [Acidobacteriota bacterium]|nr:23S rRNA (pseudouridine(1915)-N(3))-methyltransferase RlmH [Acidobacteriota bacterium]